MRFFSKNDKILTGHVFQCTSVIVDSEKLYGAPFFFTKFSSLNGKGLEENLYNFNGEKTFV